MTDVERFADEIALMPPALRRVAIAVLSLPPKTGTAAAAASLGMLLQTLRVNVGRIRSDTAASDELLKALGARNKSATWSKLAQPVGIPDVPLTPPPGGCPDCHLRGEHVCTPSATYYAQFRKQGEWTASLPRKGS